MKCGVLLELEITSTIPCESAFLSGARRAESAEKESYEVSLTETQQRNASSKFVPSIMLPDTELDTRFRLKGLRQRWKNKLHFKIHLIIFVFSSFSFPFTFLCCTLGLI